MPLMATDALVVAVAVELLLVACTSTLVLVTALVLAVALMLMLHVLPGAIGPAHAVVGVVTTALLNAVGRG